MTYCKTNQDKLQEEIDAFHASICARALLIAIDWAGSQTALAAKLGYSKHTGAKWALRGQIPPWAAVRLEKLKGFPLTAEEMRPDLGIETYRGLKCPVCRNLVRSHYKPAGCSSLLIAKHKRASKTPEPRKPRNPPSNRTAL